MAVSRTWYVPCSPRSPGKIAPELRELTKLEGLDWREKSPSGELVNQIEFANLLKQVESFEGSISLKTPDFSVRDRFAPMQTYGFAFVNSARSLRITPAGRHLIEGKRLQELFLKQMLKWQYPSWQHGGNPRSRYKYLPTHEMDIFPFVETLRVCRALGGLSKEEIAIFLLPVLNRESIPRTIQAIRGFRARRNEQRGRRQRAEFVKRVHEEHFRTVYSPDITAGEIGTRQSRTATVDAFLRKKVRNSLDVADAVIRYFRATGMFTLSSDFHGLTISSNHRGDVDRILDGMTFVLADFYSDVDRFYEHLGNPDTPVLPWESHVDLASKAIALGVQQQKARQLSRAELKETITQREIEHKRERMYEYVGRLQDKTAVQDIVSMFDRIRRRDVVDPSLFLEWNTWRAMVSIDDCREARPNFTLDDDLQPYSYAPGNRADIEVEYNESFVALVEVTRSSGARQYDTEGEPVTRHFGRLQNEENQKENPRLVYGLFIAPTINPATRDSFYIHVKHMPNPNFGGYLNIIPLTIDQFIDIFQFCKSYPDFHRGVIRDLFDRVVALKDSTDNGIEWGRQIPEVIEEWKNQWQSHSYNSTFAVARKGQEH